MYSAKKLKALNRAIEQAGGALHVADVCGKTRSAVYEWRRTQIPSEHVKTLCAMKGVTVTPNQLRPDIF